MSINTNGMDNRDVDYSSYEYQHVDFELSLDGGDDSSNATGFVQVEPLQRRGGLETHEVAELVSMYRYVTLEPDKYTEDAPLDNGALECRGVFGIDLNSNSDTLFGVTNTLVDSNDDTILAVNDAADDIATVSARGHDKSEVLDHFQFSAHLGFEDSGAGAGAFTPTVQREINFRDTFGAGPVLDSNDDIGPVLRLIKNNQEIGDLFLRYRTTMVWDVASVDDANRRFGIPQDD